MQEVVAYTRNPESGVTALMVVGTRLVFGLNQRDGGYESLEVLESQQTIKERIMGWLRST